MRVPPCVVTASRIGASVSPASVAILAGDPARGRREEDMTTKPMRTYATIATDARRVHDAALSDQKVAAFRKRVSARELGELLANLEALENESGATTSLLHAQVASGVHEAKARAALALTLSDVRDDAKLAFRGNAPLQAAFGVGATIAGDSSRGLRHLAETVLATASKYPTEAARIGLDKPGLRHLGELVDALDGAGLEHARVRTDRHDAATSASALAHTVAAEVAHVRLAARRVFRGNEAKLAAYASIAPRHTPTPRAKAKAPAV
jgi:hypothetical protein